MSGKSFASGGVVDRRAAAPFELGVGGIAAAGTAASGAPAGRQGIAGGVCPRWSNPIINEPRRGDRGTRIDAVAIRPMAF